MEKVYPTAGRRASRQIPASSPARCRLFLITALILPVLLLAGCGSTPGSDGARGKAASQERASLREGELRLSEGQHASLSSEPFPGMELFFEDFSERARFGESYVFEEEEDGEENAFCRLSSPKGDDIVLADTDAARHEDDVDERLRNFSLSMRLRFTAQSYGELTIEGRRYEHDDFAVYAGLNSDGYSLSERTEVSQRRFGAGWWENTPKGRWIDVELRVMGERVALSADGRELIASKDLRRSESGGVILSYRGELDIDDIELCSFDTLDADEAADAHSAADAVPGEALLIEELRDDFSGEALAPWWRSVGRSEPSGNSDSELHIYGFEEDRVIAGILSRALFPGEGNIRAELSMPEGDQGLIIGFGKPEPQDSVSILLAREWIIANKWVGGRGKNLFYAPMPSGAWSPAREQDLEMTVQGSALHVKLNGKPVLRSEALEAGDDGIFGNLFIGYTGDPGTHEIRSIRNLSIEGELDASFETDAYPLVRSFSTEKTAGSDPEGGGELSVTLPDFPAPSTALLEDFENSSASAWHVDSNEASSARAEIQREDTGTEAENSHLALQFSMEEGGGLHVNVGKPLRADLSSYGGIAFRARGEGIERAHISLGEQSADLGNDRNDAFFRVDGEWGEYRLPFNEEYFTLFDIPLSLGSDGSFDYSRVEYLMFEVYGYEGRGSLHVDDIRLLPKESTAQLNRRISIEDFEGSEGGAMLFPYQRLFVGDDSEGSFERSQGEGALGSRTYAKIRVRKRDHVDLRLNGIIAAQKFEGFGFFIKGSGVDTYRIEMHELEPRSSFEGELDEKHTAHVPLNNEWVEWRFPFSSEAFRGNLYHPLSNGKPDGWVMSNLSFLYPYFIHDIPAVVDIDELFLYDEETKKRVSLGLFAPLAEGRADSNIAGLIGSVFDLNLRRVKNYELSSGLDAADRNEAFEEAERRSLQFFLRPLYTLEDDELELSLEVCDAIGRKVSSRIHAESTLGTDIFTELDELSVEVVNSIAATDLSFEEHIEESPEGEREAKVWRDGLERVEEYWLRYEGLQLSASGTSGETGASKETDASAGTGIRLSPGTPIRSEGYHERGSILRVPMMLTEPYFTGIKELRAELRPEGGAAMLLWNYRARDSYNFLRIKGSTITLHINGYERRFLLEEDLDRKEPWIDLRCSRTGAQEYEIDLDGRTIGTASGPDLAFGRLGLGVEGGPASFRNIEVEFSE